MNEKIEKAIKLWKEAKKALIFTGAGMSTASGIPDFRGKNGLWKKVDPIKMVSIEAFQTNPSQFYKFYMERLSMLNNALPNEGHKIIAELEEKGYVVGVVTQNIDDLHRKAGSKNVYEVHGSVRTATCVKCGDKITKEELIQLIESSVDMVPRCKKEGCNGIYKIDVVLFGEMLPPDVWERAMDLARQVPLTVALGSSLTVYPAAYIPRITKENGGKLIIVNADPTPLDHMADVVINDDIVSTLKEIKKGLLES